MNNLISDLKFAIRNLSKSPGFVAVAIITLALGIGLNSAIFSVINMVLFRPLPYDIDGTVVAMYRPNPETCRDDKLPIRPHRGSSTATCKRSRAAPIRAAIETANTAKLP